MATRTLRVEVLADTKGYTRGMARAGASTSRFGSAAKSAGLLAASGAAAAGVASVRMAVDFDKSMRNVNSIARLPEKNLQKLQKRVLDLSGKTGQAPKVLAEGLYDLVSSGFDADDSMKILGKSARAASAGLTTTDVSTKAVAATLNSYRMPASKAGKVSDILFRTVDRGVISFEDLSSTIGDVLPFASSLGVGLEEVGAATATMTKAGISAPETMTRLKAIMSGLLKPSKDMSATLKEQGYESGESLIKAKGLQGALDLLAKSTGGSKQELAKLFPNVRALGGALALTGENSKGATDDLKGMEDASGATSRALKEQSKSISFQWDKMKAKATKLGIGFGQKLLPEIQRVFDVLNDSKLTTDEKFDKIFDRVREIVSKAIPVIADKVGRAAPKVAESFVNGFVNAGVWGQLVIGGLLLKKMGGLGAFTALGKKAGTAMGAGMATGTAAAGGAGGVAAGAAGGAAASRLAPSLRAVGGTAATVLAVKTALDFLKDKSDLGLLDQYADTLERVAKAGDSGGMRELAKQMRDTAQANGDLTKGKHLHMFADALDQTAEAGGQDLSALKDAFKHMAESSGGDLERLRTQFAKTSSAAAGMGADHAEVVKNMRGNWANLRSGTDTTLRDVRSQVRASMTMIKTRLGTDTAEGKDALAKNFKLARGAIRDAMKDGTVTTGKGLKEIRRLMVEELKMYGLSANQARMKLRSDTGDYRGSDHVGAGAGHQRGGPINMGAASGDTVPAMLERGEYVLNRKAVAKVGRDALDRVNFGSAPRFQGGGIVGLGRELQRQGYAVGEHPAFGGVGGGHDPGGYHPRGMAIDVNADNWPMGEPAALDRLYARLKNMPGIVELLWRVAGHFDHLHVAMSGAGGPLGMLGMAVPKLDRVAVGGPGSALKGLVQGALDMTHAAAQERLNRVAESMGGPGGGSYAGWSGSWVDLMGTIAGERGWNLADWKRLVDKESGGNPNARNPSSGAYGLGQFLGSTLEAYRKYGAGSSDPVDQIRAMAQYISDRYGNPSAALAFHNANNWYSAGGPVGMQTGGFTPFTPFGERSAFGAALAGDGKDRAGLGGTLAKVRTAKTPKLRRAAVNNLLNRIKGIGLPAGMVRDLATHARNSDVFGDWADRAGALTDTGAIEEALQAELERRQKMDLPFPDADQQKIVDSMLARPGGRTQLGWLTEQLGALFQWRNTLIPAEGIVSSKRTKTVGMIEDARVKLRTVRDKIREAAGDRKTLDKRREGLKKLLDKEQGKPKKKKDRGLITRLKAQVKDLGGQIRGIDRKQRPRERVRDALHDQIIPGLVTKRDDLGTARGDLLANLTDVQGAGSSMNVLSVLPPVGELGGRLLDVQMLRSDLTDRPPRVVDTDTSEPKDPEAPTRGAAEIAEIARLVFAQQQNPDLDILRYLPQFKTGGVVPGAPHEPQLIVAHGQETVIPAGGTVSTFGGGGIVLHADIDLGRGIRERVRLEFDDQGRQTRGAWAAGVLPR
jgi:TP901 family phage tail tape measure protein